MRFPGVCLRFVANALRPNKFMESAVIDTLFLIAAKWPPEYGGPGLYYKRHIRHLEKIARHVRIVAWSRGGVIDLGDASPNASAIAMKSPRGRLAAHVAGLRLAARLLWETRTTGRRCAILFTGGSISIGWRPVAIAMGALGVPVIVENVLQGADDGDSLLQARGRWLTHAAARRLRSFCPVSSGLASAVRASFPQSPAVQLPYGVDLDRYAEPSAQQRATARAAIGGPGDGVVAVCFGALHERKGQLPLVDAWLQWVERGRRFDSRLFLVGPPSDADYVASIKHRLAAAPVEAARTVTLTGFCQDTATYLRAADVYLSAARAEGLPISIVEALATGVPVVCRALQGVTDDFIHGQAVTAVVDWNPHDVGKALDALSAGDVRSRASGDARAVAEERFDIAKRLAAIHRLLMESTPPTFPAV